MTRPLLRLPSPCSVLALATSASAAPGCAAPRAAANGRADLRQWWCDTGEPRVQMNLRAGDGSDNWGFGVPLARARRAAAGGDVWCRQRHPLRLTREAGVFRFQGSFDNGRGNGTYTFSAAPAFITGMGALGYRNLSTDDLVRLAVIDVTQALTRGAGRCRLQRRSRSTTWCACAFTA